MPLAVNENYNKKDRAMEDLDVNCVHVCMCVFNWGLFYIFNLPPQERNVASHDKIREVMALTNIQKLRQAMENFESPRLL